VNEALKGLYTWVIKDQKLTNSNWLRRLLRQIFTSLSSNVIRHVFWFVDWQPTRSVSMHLYASIRWCCQLESRWPHRWTFL